MPIPWDASSNAVETLFESTFKEDSLNVLFRYSPPVDFSVCRLR